MQKEWIGALDREMHQPAPHAFGLLLQQCLAADEVHSAIIGAGAACRHYPKRAPQDAVVPYVVSHVIVSSAQTTHGVPGDPEDVLDEALVQFDPYADTSDGAEALSRAVRNAVLNDTAGVLATAKVVVTAVSVSEDVEDHVHLFKGRVEGTFFHNPQT